MRKRKAHYGFKSSQLKWNQSRQLQSRKYKLLELSISKLIQIVCRIISHSKEPNTILLTLELLTRRRLQDRISVDKEKMKQLLESLRVNKTDDL
jgi:hypothetical protein